MKSDCDRQLRDRDDAVAGLKRELQNATNAREEV